MYHKEFVTCYKLCEIFICYLCTVFNQKNIKVNIKG